MAKKDESPKTDALQQLKDDLKSGQLHTFYILCGQEAYLRTYYLEQLVKKLTGGAADAFNYHRFDSQTLTPDALADAVEAMPMMADRTLVRVEDVDLFKLTEDQRAQYAKILSDIPEYCCVVFVYSALEFKSDARMKDLHDAIRKNARVVEFKKQGERELIVWICRHFKARGKEISDDLCRYLIFLTDGSMQSLAGEIDKIATFSTTANISRGDIDAVATQTLSVGTFDLSNAITEGNYKLAMEKLQTLFALHEDPILILGGIGAQLRRLHYARIIMASGKGQETLIELTSVKNSYAAG
ncbi:MAG: DNA polymerase III subunit delta, partial [Oscillospiraceae bacterium]|nr:DNA polymerase III subunit delta [Oscillospiraceae bacterium]